MKTLQWNFKVPMQGFLIIRCHKASNNQRSPFSRKACGQFDRLNKSAMARGGENKPLCLFGGVKRINKIAPRHRARYRMAQPRLFHGVITTS